MGKCNMFGQTFLLTGVCELDACLIDIMGANFSLLCFVFDHVKKISNFVQLVFTGLPLKAATKMAKASRMSWRDRKVDARDISLRL